MTAMAKYVPTRGEAAAALKVAGADIEQIVTALKFPSKDVARREINRALAEGLSDTDRLHHRELATRRIDALLEQVWEKATDPYDDEHLTAVRAALSLIREQAQLHGAYAPQEVLITNPTTQQLLDFMREKGLIKEPRVVEVDPYADDIEDAVVVGEQSEGL